MPEANIDRGWARLRRYATFVRALIRLSPRTFTIAVAGAFLFAMCTVASSIAVEWVIDNVIVPHFDETDDVDVTMSTVIAGCTAIMVIGMLRIVGVITRRSFAGITEWSAAARLAGRVVDQLVDQPPSWHQRQSDGQLLARAGVDVDTGVSVMAPIPFATSTVLMVIVAGGWLLYTDLVMGAVAVAVFPVLMTLNVVYEKYVSRHFDDAQEALGEFSGAVHESFEAVQLVKAYGAQERETVRLAGMASVIRDARVRAVSIRGTFEAVLDTVPSLTNIGLVVLGAYRVRSGDVTIGELSGFIYMFTLLVFPLRLIGYALSELPYSYTGYSRVKATVDQPLDIDPATLLGVASAGNAVEVDHLSFTFPNEPAPVLADIDASISAGSVTALVGPTGAGKTTLVNLIAGLLAPSVGAVAVAETSRAIVAQEAFLFSGDVRENIVVGEAISDEQVWEALRLASADAFVRELPDGLDTVVGERGVTLSGGQRQRVALARALVRRPGLLILDDTTSALDPATELRVLDHLRAALRDTTVVMVASRPSTISLADEVIYIEAGRVAAQGPHDSLMSNVASYRELVEAFEADRGVSTEGAS